MTGAAARRGLLVALEGGEAAGKSTQAALLAKRLGAVATREPGGTPLGERVRSLLLDPSSSVSARAEALLMAAARAQHVAEVIEPALAAGRHVVTDRWIGSSLAYQGHGRGLPLDRVAVLSEFATGGLDADVVVLLQVPTDVAAGRQDGTPDRMEQAGDAFHRRVATGFEDLARAGGGRWVVVDGTGTVEEVAEGVWAALQALVGARIVPAS